MKRIFLVVIFMMASFILNAQEGEQGEGQIVNRDFGIQLNAIFGNLERDRIPHGILYDYAMPMADLDVYNGTLTDSTSIDVTVLSDIYKTLQLARIHPNSEADFISLEDWAARWAKYRIRWNPETETEEPTIVLAGLFYRYATLPEQSFYDGKITQENGVLRDVYVDGQWQNPYWERETMAISPPLSVWNSLRFKVVLPADLFLTNEIKTLPLTVDFDDGMGEQLLEWNTPLSVEYNKEGYYNWVFTGFTNDGETVKVKASVQIRNTEYTTSSEDRKVRILNGNHGANLRIKYAARHNHQLKKPLIIAEGFDPESVLYPEKKGGSLTLEDFENSLSKGGLDLENLLKEDNSEYDLVYIDWNNGVGDIRENAKTLEKIIEWVNLEKDRNGSKEPNVLLGQSMGGLIGRYALATMENTAKEHQVRLFIAHDSPFQGANIPVSVQFFSRHIYNVYFSNLFASTMGEILIPFIGNLTSLMGADFLSSYISPGTVLGIQDSPAALQMTKYHVTPNSQITSQFHDNWKSQLEQLGYPVLSRNIAISNGNRCGTGQGFQGGDNLYYYDETFSTKNVLTNFLVDMGMSIWGFGGGNVTLGLSSLIPGKVKIDYLADLRAIPEQNATDRVVYKGKMRYHKILWSLSSWKPTISTDVIPLRVRAINNQFLPIETFAGGVNSLQTLTNNSISAPQKGFVNPEYGFVSVLSALDINRKNGELTVGDHRKIFDFESFNTGYYSTPFENFVTEKTAGAVDNFNHISFSSRNGNWLAQELKGDNGTAINCSFVCDGETPKSILGKTQLCFSEKYTTPVIADVYTWKIITGSSLVHLDGNGSNEVTLTKRNTFLDNSGLLRLQLETYSRDCGFQTFQKDIWVGKPKVYLKSDRQDSYVNVTLEASEGHLGLQGIYEFDWERLPKHYPGGENVSFHGHYLKGKATGTKSRWGLDVQVTVRNDCGTFKTMATLYSEIRDGSGQAYESLFELMPVEEEGHYELVRVEMINDRITYGPLLPTDRVEIRVYTMNGQSVLRTNHARIDLSNLNGGIYIVNALVNQSEKVELKVYKK